MCEWWCWVPDGNTCVILETLQRNPHTPSQLREKKLGWHLSYLWKCTSLCWACCCVLHLDLQSWYISTGRFLVITEMSHLFPSIIFCFLSYPHVCDVWLISIPLYLCSLLVHNRPLSFLLSHPRSNQPHKQASQTKWLISERGVCERCSTVDCFFLLPSKCFLLLSSTALYTWQLARGPTGYVHFCPVVCVCVFIKVTI